MKSLVKLWRSGKSNSLTLRRKVFITIWDLNTNSHICKANNGEINLQIAIKILLSILMYIINVEKRKRDLFNTSNALI